MVPRHVPGGVRDRDDERACHWTRRKEKGGETLEANLLLMVLLVALIIRLLDRL